jgi:poly-beta-1,6-N-acetyl-D-glucosamine synthase
MLQAVFYIFFGALSIQLVYLLFCYSRVALYNKKKNKLINLHSPVSVIICARNEEENLKNLLNNLYIQDHPEFEIVVIDDCSTDGTHDFLKEERIRHPNLKIVKIENVPGHINSKKYGLTLGIKIAKHDLILLTDADCKPESNSWISEMTGPFINEKIKIVLGFSQYEKRKGPLNTFIRFETLYTGIQYIGAALIGKPYMGVGRNLAYRKSFFYEKKGFNKFQKITGGDDDLFVNRNASRKNTAVVIGSGSLVSSIPKDTIGKYYKQKKRHLSVGKFYSIWDKIYLGIHSLSHIVFWISFLTLLLLWWEPIWVMAGFAFRLLILTIIYFVASKKLGDKVSLWSYPVLDLMHVFYYLRTGLSVIFTKRIEWK